MATLNTYQNAVVDRYKAADGTTDYEKAWSYLDRIMGRELGKAGGLLTFNAVLIAVAARCRARHAVRDDVGARRPDGRFADRLAGHVADRRLDRHLGDRDPGPRRAAARLMLIKSCRRAGRRLRTRRRSRRRPGLWRRLRNRTPAR